MSRWTGSEGVSALPRVFIEKLESRSLLSAVGLFARPTWGVHPDGAAYARQFVQPFMHVDEGFSNTPRLDGVPVRDNAWRTSGAVLGSAFADGVVSSAPFSLDLVIVAPLEYGDSSIILAVGQFDRPPDGLSGFASDPGTSHWADAGGDGFSPGLLRAGDWPGNVSAVNPASDNPAQPPSASPPTASDSGGEDYGHMPSRELPGVVHPDGWFEHTAAGTQAQSVVLLVIRMSPADSAAAAAPSTAVASISGKEEAAPARAAASPAIQAATPNLAGAVAPGQSMPTRGTGVATADPPATTPLPAVTARPTGTGSFSLSAPAAVAVVGPAPALSLVTAIGLADVHSGPMPAPIQTSTGQLVPAPIPGGASSLTVTAVPQEISAHMAYGFVRLNPGMIFPGSVVTFVNEWATLSGSELPTSSSGAWAVTAAVLGVDAVLLGAWYRRTRRGRQETRPDPRASCEVHVEQFAERLM